MLLVLILVWLNLQLINREACSLTSSMHIYTAEFDQHDACMQVKYLQIFFSTFSNIFQHCQKIGGGRGPPLVIQQQLDLIHKEVARTIKLLEPGCVCLYQKDESTTNQT